MDVTKLRILFETPSEIYRPVCWFQQKGFDLYCGTGKSREVTGITTTLDGNALSIKWDDLDSTAKETDWKASFHASGQFHIKRNGAYDGPRHHWLPPKDIAKPCRIGLLLSKRPTLLKPYPPGTKPTRGKSSALVLPIDSTSDHRFMFEFFLSPAGEFDLPPPVLTSKTPPTGPGSLECFPLNERLFLAIRFFICGSDGLDALHPDLNFWLHFDPGWTMRS